VTYRTRQQSTALLIGLCFYTVLWLVAIVQIAVADGGSWTRRGVGIGVIAAHLVVVLWFVGYRMARAGVLVGPEAVVVRNPLGSRRLAWREIERFSVEGAGPWTVGQVTTTGGEAIQIFGIQGQMQALFPKSDWARAPIDELNRLVAERRGARDQ
jgi:PH (Pleckstrin Homology) domain-containing protein